MIKFKTFFCIALAIFGIFSIINPELAWWIEHGMPKNDEPSEIGEDVTRIGGIIAVIAAVIIFFIN